MPAPLFDPQNKLWRMFDHIADLLVLSLLWLACALPLVTAGAACCALYDAVARGVLAGEATPWRRFLRTLRRELPAATLVWVVWGALLAALVWALNIILYALRAGQPGAAFALMFCLVALAVPLGAACWMFPLLSRFAVRPVPLMLTALRLALGCLPRTLALVAVLAAAAALVWLLLLPIVLVPGIAAWLFALLLEPVFARYQGGGPQQSQQ